MLSRTSLVVAALASAVVAIPCKAVTPTLPSTGTTASDLPAPASSLTLKRIAIGHGIQNYTCAAADSSTTGATAGALAVLYDVTALYPGTPNTGLDQAAWDTLSTTVLFGQDIPLNLVDPSAAAPGTPEAPNALPEQAYAADTANPFPAQADLTVSGLPTIPFLGHHYFDAASNPTFDLTAANLLASVGKTNVTNAPADANKGILATGAVQWLLLTNKQGLSRGVESVYRVVTAGGVSQDCATAGVGAGSVPYTAFYWFLG